MPNSSLLNIKSEPELKKLDEEENIINTKMDIDENELIKGNITLINSDKGEILSRLQSLLESITIEKDKIENVSSFICDKIYKYRNLILVDVFSLIFALNHAEPKVEYLCVINEILKNNFGLEQNEVFFEKISQIFKKIIFPYAKGILLDLNNSLPTNAKPRPHQKQRCIKIPLIYFAVALPGLIQGINPPLFWILSEILSGLNVIIA